MICRQSIGLDNPPIGEPAPASLPPPAVLRLGMVRASARNHAMQLRREAGAHPREIAAEFGITQSRVRQILRQFEPRRAGEQGESHPTSLVALEMTGKVRRQLRFALEDAGITDLKQLQGRKRFEVQLLPGVSTRSVETIETVMREAGLTFLDEGRPRGVADGWHAPPEPRSQACRTMRKTS